MREEKVTLGLMENESIMLGLYGDNGKSNGKENGK